MKDRDHETFKFIWPGVEITVFTSWAVRTSRNMVEHQGSRLLISRDLSVSVRSL